MKYKIYAEINIKKILLTKLIIIIKPNYLAIVEIKLIKYCLNSIIFYLNSNIDIMILNNNSLLFTSIKHLKTLEMILIYLK